MRNNHDTQSFKYRSLPPRPSCYSWNGRYIFRCLGHGVEVANPTCINPHFQAPKYHCNRDQHSARQITSYLEKIIGASQYVEEKRRVEAFQEIVYGTQGGFDNSAKIKPSTWHCNQTPGLTCRWHEIRGDQRPARRKV